MKNKLLTLSLVLFAHAACAGDGIKTIDLNFTGTVIQPSCTITFDNDAANKSIDFGSVDVSDIRFLAQNQVGNQYSYSKTIDSDLFGIKIKGCLPNTISTNSSGKQFTLSIAAGAGSEWVSGDYMGGGLSPTSGASDYAAKILVPATFPAVAAPTSWKTLTASGVTGRDYPDTGNMGVISDMPVAFSDLISSGTGSSQSWLLPMKVALGMENTQVGAGTHAGAFSVSAIMTVSYF
ncbi:hypothetical protein C2125_11050 [Rahnella aquatilis]|nr:type 1 fimbrial protein [Rahnella aquatilis]RBQ34284.1 hypothetical protein C2125_11050 [Rahnella aquatilis]